MEAVKPGSYKFDRANIQGYVYRNDPFGGHIYLQPMLSAETPPMTITVLPFPEKGKPASFNGAIGPFSNFSAALLSSSSISVGDKIVLKIEISGQGQAANAPLPDLCCQPGFSGVFQLSDLPPVEKVSGNKKTFTVEMRPLIADIKSLPPIEFSYFIPASKTYGVLHSQAIPIAVKSLSIPPKEAPEGKKSNTPPPAADWKKVSLEPAPIEILGMEKMSAKGFQKPMGWNLECFLDSSYRIACLPGSNPIKALS